MTLAHVVGDLQYRRPQLLGVGVGIPAFGANILLDLPVGGLELEDEQAAAWADLAAVLLRSQRARYASPAGGEFWSECLKRRPPNRPDRWILFPAGRFQASAREILEGNPERLRRFRDSTGQPPPIVPYPGV